MLIVGEKTGRKQIAARQFSTGTNFVGVQSEGEAEGGCRGNSASPEPKRSPAALLVQSRVPQKSFLFLLEEEIGRAQNKKLRRKLFCGTASEASGGGAERQFLSKKFRAKFRISHKKRQQKVGVFCGVCLKKPVPVVK